MQFLNFENLGSISGNAALRLILAALLAFLPSASLLGWEPKDKAVAEGRKPMKLRAAALNESSGLAFSNVNTNCLWSHNDSGDTARLMAFNSSGKFCGKANLKGVTATDWEDMVSFEDQGPRLLVADVGDNQSERKSVSLYIFDEPNPREKSAVDSYQHIVVRYIDGPQNCEAVAVDVKSRRVLLLGKSALVAKVHEIPLPQRSHSTGEDPRVSNFEFRSKVIQQVAIPLATGMDLCPKTGDLWISSYLNAFRYRATKRSSLESRLGQLPEMYELPKLKQVEAIAVDGQGSVWVTSEGTPAKIQRVVTTN